MKRPKYRTDIPADNLCIRRSTIFDNPKYKYNMFIYKKILQGHEATNFRVGHYLGQFNLPTVLIFSGITARRAVQALNNLPEFHTWGCLVDVVNWNLDHVIPFGET